MQCRRRFGRQREVPNRMIPVVSFSESFDQALILATLAHDRQPRKGTLIPYIMHPVHVARLLERHGYSEEVVIAGLLHDVLEDAKFADLSLQDRLRPTRRRSAGQEAQ